MKETSGPPESELRKVALYEGEHLPYSELGKDATFDCWGSSIVTNEDGSQEWMSFYNDARVTDRLFTEPVIENLPQTDQPVIADIGGGEGQMLAQIIFQMERKGVKPLAVLSEIDKAKLKIAKQKHPEISPVQADGYSLPFADQSMDAIVSRMFLQYNPFPSDEGKRPTQFDLLKEMARVSKDGAVAVLVWPGNYSNTAKQDQQKAYYNDAFWNTLTWQRVDEYVPGESLEERNKREAKVIGLREQRARSFTPGETMAGFAEKAGFELIDGEEIDWIEFRYTADAITNRFIELQEPGKEANLEWVQEAFDDRTFAGEMLRRLKAMGEVSDWNGKNAVRLPISRLVLKKNK